jgi:hypothetical protein
MNKEYVIWGCDKNHPQEIILMDKCEGKVITDKILVRILVKYLADNYNCYNIRIQEIDLTDNNITNSFVKSIK